MIKYSSSQKGRDPKQCSPTIKALEPISTVVQTRTERSDAAACCALFNLVRAYAKETGEGENGKVEA